MCDESICLDGAMSDRPPPWIDAPWWEVYGAQLRAEQLSGQAWVDALARAWCLVRRPDSLTAAQLAEQYDMVGRLTGHIFLTTRPRLREVVDWTGDDRAMIQLCGATDGLGLDPDNPDEPFGRCNLPADHETGGWHQEIRDGQLWAEWRGPKPGEKCGICGKDGAEH